MPNGMTDPIGITGWKSWSCTNSEGDPTSWHTVPADQFVHSIDDAASCLCGPEVNYRETRDGGPIPMVTHFALSAEYYEDSDWGPDGPEDSSVPN
jgi:hypothetical protein